MDKIKLKNVQLLRDINETNFFKAYKKLIKRDNLLTNDEKLYAIAVMGLENLAEAAWYQKSVLGNNSIQETLKGINYKGFVISQANFKGVFDKETLQKYLQFYINNNLEVKEPDVVKKLEEESGFVKGEKQTNYA